MLILEDNAGRNAHFRATYPDAVMVETASEAITQLSTGKWALVSLDHDLNNEAFVDSARPDCGMEVVRWIVANRPVIGRVVVHTVNRKASELMYEALAGAGYDVVRAPFGGEYDGRQ